MGAKAAKAAIADINAARKAVTARQKELAAALQAGDEQKAAEIVHWLTTSQEAAIAAAIEYGRAPSLKDRPTLEACLEATSKIDLTQPIAEPVRVWAKLKSSGTGWRPICAFDLMHRIAQQMLKAILALHYKPRAFQASDQSLPKIMARVRKAIGSGKHFFAHLDISDFFRGFRCEALEKTLPLPAGAVGYVVCSKEYEWKACRQWRQYPPMVPHILPNKHQLIEGARQGIPQGSSISPLVAAMECARLPIPMEWEAGALTNYVDDFLLLGASQAEVDERAAMLIELVGALPGGQFKLKPKAKGHLSDGVVFLGHHLRLRDGAASIAPSEGNFNKLLEKIAEFRRECGIYYSVKPNAPHPLTKPDADAVKIAVRKSLRYLQSWTGAFAGCDDLGEYAFTAMKEVADMLAAIGLPADALGDIEVPVAFDVRDHFGDVSG
jgi:hypothetical protein